MIRPLVFLLLAVAAPAFAQDEVQVPRPWEHATSDLPTHPDIRFGEFENGVRFAWMNNVEPDQRLYLRMHVNAGSLAERPTERGMAHFLEHMAFNSSANFPPGTLVEWLQERGLDFGAHTNAYTSFSETVYMLDLPNADPAGLQEALWVMRDYAGELLLATEEVEAEKGVIDGEERERDSAMARVAIKMLQHMLAGTRLADRIPIGVKEVRDAFSSESVRTFYERWYRPENVTLILVGDLGDVDPEPLFRLAFADFTAAEGAGPVVPEPALGTISDDLGTVVILDDELVMAQVSAGRVKSSADRSYDRARLKSDLPLDTAHRMLNLRFAEMAQAGDAPFLAAFVYEEDLVGVASRESLAVTAPPEQWRPALEAAEQELRRALLHGFHSAELDEIRADSLLALDESVESAKTRSSAYWAGKLVTAAEGHYVPTSAATDRAILGPVIEGLTVESCQAALVAAWNDGRLTISALGPTGMFAGAEDPEGLLGDVWRESTEVDVEAHVAEDAVAFAYASTEDVKGGVTSRSLIEDLGIESVELSNGVRLFLKATDFKARQVRMLALLGEGELSIESDRTAVSYAAGDVFEAGGLGKHDEDQLRRLLAGRQVGIRFNTATNHFSLGGSTTREDLLRTMEVACAYLTDPGWRDTGLVVFKKHLPQMFEALGRQPQGPLATRFMPMLYQGDPRFGMPSREELEAVSVDDVRGWLEPHLREAPLTICIVGDFDVDAAIDEARRTFGVLPPRRAIDPFAGRRVAPEMQSGLVERYEIESRTPKSLVYVTFPTTDGIDALNRRSMRLLARVLNDRVRLEIRERLGATYSPQASADSSEVFKGVGRISIMALSDPTGTKSLVDACLAVADKLVESGVTDDELKRLKEPLLASIRDSQRSNDWWLVQIARLHDRQGALDQSRSIVSDFEAVGAERLSELARRFLDPERASVLIVDPTDA